MHDLTVGPKKMVFKELHVSNLLEFGRPLHAEMAVLMSAAERGLPVKGGTLYCTTFPCHLCARLIIAAGIKRVVYIEPYHKSQALDLYNDSIVVDQSNWVDGKVNFEPFVGISPRAYNNLFRHEKKRKNSDGKTLKWPPALPSPKMNRFVNSYIIIEDKTLTEVLAVVLDNKGINLN